MCVITAIYATQMLVGIYDNIVLAATRTQHTRANILVAAHLICVCALFPVKSMRNMHAFSYGPMGTVKYPLEEDFGRH